MEHEEQAEKLEEELQRLDEHAGEVGEQIDEARRDWEAKEDDPTVPGAQPAPSDQLPEEGPAAQVVDDGGAADTDESHGVPGAERTATGNPDAAGADEQSETAAGEGDAAQ